MQHRHQNREQYFAEQSETCRQYFIPYINHFKTVDSSLCILEVGCGDGGNLLPFVEQGCSVTGIDLSETRISQAQAYYKNKGLDVSFVNDSVFNVSHIGLFDVVLLNDVIEHIFYKKRLLRHLHRFLKPDGVIFIGYPAWQMPFGGHQQICYNKWLSVLPYFHLLPVFAYKWVLKLGNEPQNVIDELLSIRSCRITVETFRKVVTNSDFIIKNERFYLINPHYETKFGIKPVLLTRFLSLLPIVRNLFITASFAVLLKKTEQ